MTYSFSSYACLDGYKKLEEAVTKNSFIKVSKKDYWLMAISEGISLSLKNNHFVPSYKMVLSVEIPQYIALNLKDYGIEKVSNMKITKNTKHKYILYEDIPYYTFLPSMVHPECFKGLGNDKLEVKTFGVVCDEFLEETGDTKLFRKNPDIPLNWLYKISYRITKDHLDSFFSSNQFRDKELKVDFIKSDDIDFDTYTEVVLGVCPCILNRLEIPYSKDNIFDKLVELQSALFYRNDFKSTMIYSIPLDLQQKRERSEQEEARRVTLTFMNIFHKEKYFKTLNKFLKTTE